MILWWELVTLHEVCELYVLCAQFDHVEVLCSWEENVWWTMFHFDHGYVTCLYVPFYLASDACTEYVAILLVYVSCLACCSALCLFEKHMLAFVALIHALPTRGRHVHQFMTRRESIFCIKGKKCICPGGACIHAGGALCVTWILVVLFYRWCRALLSHLDESAILVVLSRCPCLRGSRFFSLKWSCLSFCLAFDHLFEFLVCFFSFSLFSELVTMCVVNALIKGEIEDQSVRGPVDGRSLVCWVIDNMVWTDS
jgi:hypothetical protein